MSTPTQYLLDAVSGKLIREVDRRYMYVPKETLALFDECKHVTHLLGCLR